MITSKFFNMGKLVVTNGINKAMMENKKFVVEVNLCLKRYAVKDLGNLDEKDKQANEDALQYPDDLYCLQLIRLVKERFGLLLIAFLKMPEIM